MTDFSTILMWVNQDPKYPNSFIIKTANQKLFGLARTDKKGQTYWKFKVKKSGLVPAKNNPEPRPVMDNIQKFQNRQEKTEQLNNYGNNSNASEK